MRSVLGKYLPLVLVGVFVLVLVIVVIAVLVQFLRFTNGPAQWIFAYISEWTVALSIFKFIIDWAAVLSVVALLLVLIVLVAAYSGQKH